MRKPPNICLFCKSVGPFTRVEHPVPESLGNNDTVLPPGFVCDRCNQYFGSKIERAVLSAPPFCIERVAASIRTKKGKYAKFMSPEVSLHSTGFWDQAIFLGSHDWYARTFADSERGVLWVDRAPNQRLVLCRFLLKIGLELLLIAKGRDPYEGHYDRARRCARFGNERRDWQMSYAEYPSRSDLVLGTREDEFGPLETRQIYEYEIGAMPSGDQILFFAFMTHCFACNLSQPSLGEYVAGFNRVNDFCMRLMA